MACNHPRWNWLIQGSYNPLTPEKRVDVITLFVRKQGSSISDDIALYESMVELGVKIKGTDPSPPKPILITAPGAEEYDQIMADLDSIGL